MHIKAFCVQIVLPDDKTIATDSQVQKRLKEISLDTSKKPKKMKKM